MLEVGQPDEDGADERANHLGDDVEGHVAPAKAAADSQADGDGRVQVRAADNSRRIGADEDGQGPGRGDDDPATAVALGLTQDNVSNHAIAQQDQKHGADKFADKWTVHCFLLICSQLKFRNVMTVKCRVLVSAEVARGISGDTTR